MDNFYNQVVVATKIYHTLNTQDHYDSLVKCLKEFEKKLKTLNPSKIQKFKYTKDSYLRSIMLTLQTYQDPTLKSLHQKIFKNILGYGTLRMRVTEIFEDFIRGITLFTHHDHSSSAKPLYHRQESCGYRTLAKHEYNSTRTCNIIHNEENLRENKKRIYTCYLERLLYDELFKQYTLFFPEEWDQESHQDVGHRKMLQDTQKHFETCFPNLMLKLKITYDHENDPIILVIEKYSKRYQVLQEKETYIKIKSDAPYIQKYLDPVYAKKEVKNQVLYKVQYEYQPSHKWSKTPNEFVILEKHIDQITPR